MNALCTVQLNNKMELPQYSISYLLFFRLKTILSGPVYLQSKPLRTWSIFYFNQNSLMKKAVRRLVTLLYSIEVQFLESAKNPKTKFKKELLYQSNNDLMHKCRT
jgi:hypothetical protein